MGIFSEPALHIFLRFPPAFLTESCSFWYGLKDLFTLHKLAEKLLLPLKLMASHAVEGIRSVWAVLGANGLI